jgi:predicted CXXCH cytochrome family protein
VTQTPSSGPATRDIRRWEIAGLLSLAAIVLAIPLSLLRSGTTAEPGAIGETPATFAGTESCRECHQTAYDRWKGSDHDHAMAVARDDTVRGDFNDTTFTDHGVTSRFYRRDGKFFVNTEGPGGKMAEFEITYTFGWRPLQQYLIPFPGGRLQALSVAWDTEQKRWFYMYPGQAIPASDWLHWTRNGQNWNGMCAECHSTNLKKNYDPQTQTYDTTWSDINVGCEACHGPGSRHVSWAKIPPMARPALANRGLVVSTANLSGPQQVDLCAPCHSRRAEIGDYDHTGGSLLNHMLPSLLTEGLYEADGQQLEEVYKYASFLQSKMYARGVGCFNCHDSHSVKLLKEGNELCLQCHQREVYDTADHHFHKAVYQGKPSDGVKCMKCHMVERPYMVIDWRADHSFRRPRPDLTLEIGTPNACNQSGCHQDKSARWAADAYRKWYGEARRPQFGTTFAKARKDDPSAQSELVRIVDNALQPAIVRATALELLDRYPGEAATKTSRAAILAEDPLIRWVATEHAPVFNPADSVSLLAPLLADPIKAVRLAALSRLASAPKDLFKPYQREAFDRALTEYRAAMAYTLDFASSGMNLGNLETALGHPAEAEKYYRLALGIDDLFFPAKVNLAVLLSGQGRNDEAERLLREVVGAYPDNGSAAYLLGLLLVEQQKHDEALTWLRRAADLMPSNARAHYNLGLLLQQRGQLDEAYRELSRALEVEPTNLDYLFALADHTLRRGRLQEALALSDRMIAAHPDQRIGHDMKAEVEKAIAGSRR